MFSLTLRNRDCTILNQSECKFVYESIFVIAKRLMKYFPIFYDLISFKYEYKHNLIKEDKNQENLNLLLQINLKNLNHYDIDCIYINVNIKKENNVINSKSANLKLNEIEMASFSKTFSFKLKCFNIKDKCGDLKLNLEIEIYYLYENNLKLKFIEIKEIIN